MNNMDMSSDVKPSADAASSMSHGEIKKIDTAAGKLTIKHGPLENLGMDAMTMVFKAQDPAMLSQVKVGDKIDFVAEEVNGALTVVKLQKR
jgi:Cu/Ag efflux protein CusF